MTGRNRTPGHPRVGVEELIRRAKQFVRTRQAEKILLADIARAVGASPAYLTDIFRRSEGVPLHQYVTRIRLERALTAVPQTDDLSALALDVGFSSHSHFTAAFRKRFGCTPSQYRRRIRRAADPALQRPRQ